MLDSQQFHLLCVRLVTDDLHGIVDAVGEDADQHLLITQEHPMNRVEQPLEELDVLIGSDYEDVNAHEVFAQADRSGLRFTDWLFS